MFGQLNCSCFACVTAVRAFDLTTYTTSMYAYLLMGVLVALLCGQGRAEDRSGLLLNTTTCEGVFDFNVNSTLLASAESSVSTYDIAASFYLNNAPVWVLESCKRAVRKIQCMITYEDALGE